MIAGDANPMSSAAPGAVLARGDLAGLDQITAEAVALFVPLDVRPLRGVAGFVDWRLCGALSSILIAGTFSGDEGEVLLLPSHGRLGKRRLFLFGLGPLEGCSVESMRRACARAADVMARAGVRQAVLAAPQAADSDLEPAFIAAAQAEVGRRELVRAILVEQLKR